MALTPEQRRVIRELKAAPSYGRASPMTKKALMLASRVESNHSTPNQANSDRDSEGALQQRPSQGWGPTAETNTQDAEQFLKRAIPLAQKYGSAGQLAQAVQRSAFPDRYDQHSAEGDRLIRGDAGGGSSARGASSRTVTTTTPGVDNSGARRQAIAAFLTDDSQQDPLDLALALAPLKDVAGKSSTKTVRRAESGSMNAPSGASGNFKITGPNPGRIQPKVKSFLRELGGTAGETIVGSDGTGHSKMTTSGNVSEHYTGAATDIPATGKHLTRLGQGALVAAGWSPARAKQAKGGIYNVNRRGRRYQIIFNTNEGGNHFDHLHVGVR